MTAETQLNETKNQIRQNEADTQIGLSQLQTLTASATPLVISDNDLRELSFDALTDSGKLEANPSLTYLKNQILIAGNQKKVESAKSLPDLMVGYFNQTLIGIQNIDGQDKYFGSGQRFQGFQVGIAIPLWFGPHASRIKAAEFNKKAVESNYNQYQITLQGQFQQAVQEYLKNQNSLEYYKTSALPNADLILKQVQTGFKNGEIGYSEYLLGLKNALAIRENYLQALNQYNQSITTLEFLLGYN